MRILLFVAIVSTGCFADEGTFWHVTDLHWDFTRTATNPGRSCGKGGTNGTFGDYKCDSPYRLIQSSVDAMKQIKAKPDFLIWTGDNTPHIYDNAFLDKTKVLEIMQNLTSLIDMKFPNATVYAALGNHDWSPKNQLSPETSDYYDQYATMWRHWLAGDTNATETFKYAGYYTMKRPGNSKLRIFVLNTNLYDATNNRTKEQLDPGHQMQWLANELKDCAERGEKAILVAHMQPGVFEKHRSRGWFSDGYNNDFTDLLVKHADVIAAVHMSHHHTDSFRLVRDNKGGAVVNSLLFAPSVTPWATTLPGVIGGKSNNPAIRLVTYDRNSGKTMNIKQYYLNLTEANENGTANWKELYDFKSHYGVHNVTTETLATLATNMEKNDFIFQKYYKMNGVSFDASEKCVRDCKVYQLCAINYLRYKNHTKCVEDGIKKINSASGLTAPKTIVVFVLLFIANTL